MGRARKQRHTVKRVFDRLIDEAGFSRGFTTGAVMAAAAAVVALMVTPGRGPRGSVQQPDPV